MQSNGSLLINGRGPCTSCIGGSLLAIGATDCSTLSSSGAAATQNLRNPHDVCTIGDFAYMVDTYNNRIVRYQLSDTGAPQEVGSTPVPEMNNGGRGIVAHQGLGEIFVSDCCFGGNVRRFKVNPDGSLTPNGLLTGNGMNQPHGMTVTPWGELLVLNIVNSGSISRFTFDASGNAVANGLITGMHSPVAAVFTTWGEMIVFSHHTTTTSRYTFDGSGNASLNGTFTAPTNSGDAVASGTLPVMIAATDTPGTCPGDFVSISVVGANPGWTYQWRFQGQPIDTNENASAATSTLVVGPITLAAEGFYDCVVTADCGSSTTNAVLLDICPPDYDCSGSIDDLDIIQFFTLFEEGNPLADANGDDGIDDLDIAFFFASFESGC